MLLISSYQSNSLHLEFLNVLPLDATRPVNPIWTWVQYASGGLLGLSGVCGLLFCYYAIHRPEDNQTPPFELQPTHTSVALHSQGMNTLGLNTQAINTQCISHNHNNNNTSPKPSDELFPSAPELPEPSRVASWTTEQTQEDSSSIEPHIYLNVPTPQASSTSIPNIPITPTVIYAPPPIKPGKAAPPLKRHPLYVIAEEAGKLISDSLSPQAKSLRNTKSRLLED